MLRLRIGVGVGWLFYHCLYSTSTHEGAPGVGTALWFHDITTCGGNSSFECIVKDI